MNGIIAIILIVLAIYFFGGQKYGPSEGESGKNSAVHSEGASQAIRDFMSQLGLRDEQAARDDQVGDKSKRDKTSSATRKHDDTDTLSSSDREELDDLLEKVAK